MDRGAPSPLFPFLLLVLVLGAANSAKKSYAEILSNEKIEFIFELFTPKKVLEHYETDGKIDLRSDCSRDLKLHAKAVAERELWAMKLLDASSAIPSGILEGNIVELGSFDQCIAIRWHGIQGHHCMYEIDPEIEDNTLPFNPTLSICLPSSCGRQDVVALVNSTIVSSEVGVNVVGAHCTNTGPINWWRKDLMIWAILYNAWIVFLVFCTVCHIATRHEPSKNHIIRTLTRFSMLDSSKKILSTEAHGDNLPVVNGLRVLSTVSIVYLHTYFIQFFGVNANLMYMTEWYSSWNSIIPLVSLYSVDTFFTMSGFLMAYSYFKQMRSQKKFNILSHYIHRYLRLTPPMALCMYFGMMIVPITFAGPRMQSFNDIFITGCNKYWWSTLLYIQNFIAPYDFRFQHYWTLCVDMQLFWISPLILYHLHRKPKCGFFILGSLVCGSLIITAWIVGINGYRSTFVTAEPDLPFAKEAYLAVYTPTYTRASPYLLGILLAYQINKNNFKPSKTFLNIGWFSTVVVLASYPFTLKYAVSSDEYHTLREVLFTVFLRPIWSSCMCWIIYASHHEPTGLISRFLSWKYFLPLSRLCYSVYLVHILLPMFAVSTSKISTNFSDISIIQNYLVYLPLAFILGFIVSILYEIPFFVLEDIIFGRKTGFLKSENEKLKLHKL